MDDDLHIIKPVEVLKNIAEPTPAKQREQRKNRQNPGKKKPAQLSAERSFDAKTTENDQSTLDYCA